MTTDRSLPRQERLRSLGAVRRLFESGQSGFIFPFRYLWFAEADSERSVEVLFSVPKSSTSAPTGATLLRRRTRGLPPAEGASGGVRAGKSGCGADLFVEGGSPLQNRLACRPPDSGVDRGAHVSGFGAAADSPGADLPDLHLPRCCRRRAASSPPARSTPSEALRKYGPLKGTWLTLKRLALPSLGWQRLRPRAVAPRRRENAPPQKRRRENAPAAETPPRKQQLPSRRHSRRR